MAFKFKPLFLFFNIILYIFIATNRVQALEERDIQWKIYNKTHGITIYSGKLKNNTSGITPIKVSTILNFKPGKVAYVLSDSSQKKEWVTDLIASHPIEVKSPLNRIEYSRYHSPWPFYDRTFVVQSIGTIDKEKHLLKMIIKSVEDKRAPRNKKFVRGITHLGIIILKPINNYSQTYFEMIFLTDFKGNIPKWIINFLQKRWPFKLVKSLKNQLSKASIKTPKGYNFQKLFN